MVYEKEMEFFGLTEGQVLSEREVEGWTKAAKYVFDRNSYKVMRRLWNDMQEQFNLEANSLMETYLLPNDTL